MISTMIAYGKTLMGARYTAWKEGDACLGETTPFWAAVGSPPLDEQIREEGICCTGLLNVMCRAAGLTPPLVREGQPWAGTTDAWWETMAGVARPYDPSFLYPPGTILLAPYEGPALEDQGHAGMIIENGAFLHSWLHGGVSIDISPVESHVWARYRVAVLLKDWVPVLQGAGKT